MYRIRRGEHSLTCWVTGWEALEHTGQKEISQERSTKLQGRQYQESQGITTPGSGREVESHGGTRGRPTTTAGEGKSSVRWCLRTWRRSARCVSAGCMRSVSWRLATIAGLLGRFWRGTLFMSHPERQSLVMCHMLLCAQVELHMPPFQRNALAQAVPRKNLSSCTCVLHGSGATVATQQQQQQSSSQYSTPRTAMTAEQVADLTQQVQQLTQWVAELQQRLQANPAAQHLQNQAILTAKELKIERFGGSGCHKLGSTRPSLNFWRILTLPETQNTS